jgi:hypothetical protein
MGMCGSEPQQFHGLVMGDEPFDSAIPAVLDHAYPSNPLGGPQGG